MHDTRYNYYALTVAIFCQCTAEMAFEKLESPKPSQVKQKVGKIDIERMVELKARGYTYRQLADMFGITFNAAIDRIRRWEGRKYGNRHHQR